MGKLLIVTLLLVASTAFSSQPLGLYDGEGPKTADTSGNGNNLTESGTVPQSTTGAPSGTYWLGGPFSNTNYYTIPAAVFTGQPSSGVIAFYYKHANPPATWGTPINVQNAPLNRYFLCEIGATNMQGVYTNTVGSGINTGGSAHGMSVGTTYIVRYEWGAFGTRFKVNGSTIVSNSNQVGWGANMNAALIGNANNVADRQCNGLVDLIYINTADSDAVFPPPSTEVPRPGLFPFLFQFQTFLGWFATPLHAYPQIDGPKYDDYWKTHKSIAEKDREVRWDKMTKKETAVAEKTQTAISAQETAIAKYCGKPNKNCSPTVTPTISATVTQTVTPTPLVTPTPSAKEKVGGDTEPMG